MTRLVSATESATGAAAVRFVISTDEPAQITTESDTATQGAGDLAIGKLSFPIADNIAASSVLGAVGSSSNSYALEAEANIPEIDIKVDSTAITAQTKKLKAKWTPELGCLSQS